MKTQYTITIKLRKSTIKKLKQAAVELYPNPRDQTAETMAEEIIKDWLTKTGAPVIQLNSPAKPTF